MTIAEAINRVDEIQPNTISYNTKVAWLSQLDGELWANVCCHYMDNEHPVCPKYDEITDGDTVLVVGHPFEELYVYFLQAKIFYAYEEYAKFNTAMAMHERDRASWRNHYNNTHTAVEVKLRFW